MSQEEINKSQSEINKNIVREAFEKWDETKASKVGIDHWRGILSDKIKFKSLANGANGAKFTELVLSRDDMERYFEGLTGTMDMLYYTIDHYIAEDDKVVCVGKTAWKVKATGEVYETPKCDVVTFEDGKIVAFYEYYDTAGLIALAPDK